MDETVKEKESYMNVSSPDLPAEYLQVKLEELDDSDQFVDGNDIHDDADKSEKDDLMNNYPDEVEENSQQEINDSNLHGYVPDEGTTDEGCSSENMSIIEDEMKNYVNNFNSEHMYQLGDYDADSKSNLKVNVQSTDLNSKPNKCHLCNYATEQKSNLKRHMECIHFNTKHQCSICQYAATSKNRLKIHVESVHFNIKCHKCLLCEYATSEKKHLKRHIESVHLNPKQHKCNFCDHATNHKSNLKIHISSVHLNNKAFKCSSCEYATNHNCSLKRHVASAHSNK